MLLLSPKAGVPARFDMSGRYPPIVRQYAASPARSDARVYD